MSRWWIHTILVVVMVAASAATGCRRAGPSLSSLTSAMDSTSLPVVNIAVDLKALLSFDYTAADLTIYDRDGSIERLHSRVKYRGKSTRWNLKKSFAVKLTDDAGETRKVTLFGIRKDDNWILDAMSVDRLRMRNRVCFDVWNAMSALPYDTKRGRRNGTDGVFVELFINGEYNGIYCLTDKVNRSLLGIKKSSGRLWKSRQWSDAVLLKGYTDREWHDSVMWNEWVLKWPKSCSGDEWAPLADLIDTLTQADDEAFVDSYHRLFYDANIVDYTLLQLAMGLKDMGMKNTYISLRDSSDSSRFLLTPWDMDESTGATWQGDYTDQLGTFELIRDTLRLRLLAVDGLVPRLASRWNELKDGPLSEQLFGELAGQYAEQFVRSGAWDREWERWSGEPVTLSRDVHDELNYVRSWYASNWQHLDSLFNNETDFYHTDL